MQWRWTEGGTVMPVEDSDIWPVIVEIGGRREEWQKEEG